MPQVRQPASQRLLVLETKGQNILVSRWRLEHPVLSCGSSSRQKVNKIQHLQDNNGRIFRDENGLKGSARNYFIELFQRANSVRQNVINVVPQSITLEDNEAVTTPFSLEEFKEATFSMQIDKCPGPDGFNPGFYQKFWNMCGTEIYEAGCSWLA